MSKDKALTLALEALNRGESQLRWVAIAAIEEALAQPEPAAAQPEPKPVMHSNVTYKLAQKELTRLAEENFGRMPNDEWANGVLDLRDYLEAQRTGDTK